jgi:hypothetical protein
MAQTDTRPGFRLPWTAEHDAPTGQTEATTSEGADTPSAEAPAEGSTVVDETVSTEPSTQPQEPETSDMIDTTATPSARRPTKFMAELSRAMQSAVETSRDETLARLGTDAKTVVEEIHAASAVEAAELRRRADDDVAAVREWSKAEIARIREETEARIALRKTALDGEMDQHGLVVESRVQQVGATVTQYEEEMAAFFERLRNEEDPTRIAAMAERMPEPPDLAGVAAAIVEPIVAPASEPAAFAADESGVKSDGSDETNDSTDERTYGENQPEMGNADINESGESYDAGDAVESDGSDETTTPDFAAAEAEAAAFSGDVEDEAVSEAPEPAVDHEAAAAALAATADDSPPQGERATTRVMVTGLVSVASIATFKRSLGRVPGVSTIGVASGPDGEFVFTVSHDAGIGLVEAIAGLPGFEAHITAETHGGLEVTAHDPDTGS